MTLTPTRLTLDDLFAAADLTAAIEAGHVTRKAHPSLPISIYTYTPVCQYGHIWTPVTMRCRGLIADDASGEIVALPFPKIFVTAMHGRHDFAPTLPGEPFEVFEKADGSLAIVFHHAGRWHAASKGSFISEQARWAQRVLDRADTGGLDEGVTYLAEAIYPGNRIVVDYGARQDLVLLGAYRPADGTEVELSQAAAHWAPIGSVVRSWGFGSDVPELEERAAADTSMDGAPVGGTQEEGYVIRFASGVRAKLKLSAYLGLHRLYTGTNERTVWEALAAGREPGTLFDRVPDEFRDWVEQIATRQREQVAGFVAGVEAEFARIPAGLDRKAFAAEAGRASRPGAMFRLYDGRDVLDMAWRSVRPRGDAPFKTDEEG
ncbi:RNA ligase [Kitasatospora sp. NBC_00315]|uniref:RNA ligase n=1 Tax=Kitasatospora sp. NBC_00315 TaxID=2975963 RepID=UPI003246963A